MLGICPALLLIWGQEASKSQKGVVEGGDARTGWVFLSCRSPGFLYPDKLQAEPGGWGPKLPVCESLEGGSFSTIANFVLFWVRLSGLVSYLAETAVALPNTSLISEFSEAVGGMSTDSQLGKEIWKSFTRPRQ